MLLGIHRTSPQLFGHAQPVVHLLLIVSDVFRLLDILVIEVGLAPEEDIISQANSGTRAHVVIVGRVHEGTHRDCLRGARALVVDSQVIVKCTLERSWLVGYSQTTS